MKPRYRIVLYFAAFPSDIPGWIFGLLLSAAWGARSPQWSSGVVLVTLKRDSWVGRTFSRWGGLTLGHCVVLFDDQSDVTLEHELVHVKQCEGNAMLGLMLGAGVCWISWVSSLVVLVGIPWLMYVAAGLTALLRGESYYSGNEEEQAAYAIGGGRQP